MQDTDYENSKKNLNQILREYYNKNKQNIVGYPEQFDITFDFVPRMCEQDNCDICPISRITLGENNFERIYYNDKNMYCSVILVGCNYKNNCVGKDKCKIV